MNSDLVERLRIWAACVERQGNMSLSLAIHEAAMEIERLREQLRLANIDNFNTTAEAERLQEERDEARRMLCEEWAKQDGLPLDWQGRRGAEGMAEFVKWDCFKENTND